MASGVFESGGQEAPWGWWIPRGISPVFAASEIAGAAAGLREPAFVVRDPESGAVGLGVGGSVATAADSAGGYALLGMLPPLYPEWLGDRSFAEAHGVRFPYVAGSMANGIASVELVISFARAGILSFFGAAGLLPERVEKAILEIRGALGDDATGWGATLIHSPQEPETERRLVELYLELGVTRVEASAFLGLTANVVRFAASGLHVDASGRLARRNHVLAKISRPELALAFMSPAPESLLRPLVESGALSAAEAELAARVPIAEDITVEGDSGGHTDNRPISAVFPVVARLRDLLVEKHGYERPLRVGVAGGLGSPSALAAAFALGAAYVMTGSVNQTSLEAGLSSEGKELLAQAGLADVVMAPAADMFESGVRVQVLKRGTFFGAKARRLFEIYDRNGALEELPAATREWLEREVFRASLEEVWSETRAFFSERNPEELARAEGDGKHKMALLFRWYLGKSSRWAIEGDAGRRFDYQIWCGPAIGDFQDWISGSFLEPLANRGCVQIALNLLEGAAVLTRAHQLRCYGVDVREASFEFAPRRLRLEGRAA
jgi:PfaD family protein